MRVFFQVATAPALIRMHMADERTLIPSNLTAHIAPCFIGAKIGILVIVGILSPKNDGVVRLPLIRLPYCRIGLVFRNRNITGGRGFAPAEEGIALSCRFGNIVYIKGRTVFRINRLRTVNTSVYIKDNGIVISVIINFNLGRSVCGNRCLRNALAVITGLIVRHSFGICSNISCQLDCSRFTVIIIFKILIVVINRIRRRSRNIIECDFYIFRYTCKIKREGIFIFCIKRDIGSESLGLFSWNRIIEQLRYLYCFFELSAFCNLRAVGLRNHAFVGIVNIVHRNRYSVPVFSFRNNSGTAEK